jgi:hypothetical protein
VKYCDAISRSGEFSAQQLVKIPELCGVSSRLFVKNAGLCNFCNCISTKMDVSIPTVTTDGNSQMKDVEYYAKEL